MKLLTLTFAFALGASTAMAGDMKPMDVSFDDYGAVEASLTGVPGDAANGAKIMVTKSTGNCISCHEVSALKDSPFHGEVGPLLDGVGDRWNAAELRGIVSNAKKTFDGTIMPAYFKNSGYIRPGDAFTGKAAKGQLDTLLTAQDVEDVVAFLATLKE